eukprot:1292618-Rhodomonas_salina.1
MSERALEHASQHACPGFAQVVGRLEPLNPVSVSDIAWQTHRTYQKEALEHGVVAERRQAADAVGADLVAVQVQNLERRALPERGCKCACSFTAQL